MTSSLPGHKLGKMARERESAAARAKRAAKTRGRAFASIATTAPMHHAPESTRPRGYVGDRSGSSRC